MSELANAPHSTTWTPPSPAPRSEHKLASAADFRARIKDEDCFEEPRDVPLPTCGLTVRLRRPKPLLYTLMGVALPGIPEIAAGAQTPGESEVQRSAEETERVANWLANLWRNVFVHPKLSLRPGFDEIHPDWIPEPDQKFIWQWIRGEVTDSGESLSTFPASGEGRPGAA